MKIVKNMNKKNILLLTSIILMASIMSIVSAADSGYGYGSSSGSSSGTGGSGVISGELFDNIAKYQTNEKDLISGIPVVFPFTVPELAIYQVIVTGKENEFDVSIRVESLKGTSRLAKISAPGNVYTNENVWFGSQRIRDVLVKFRVKNSWIIDNNVRTEDIRLLKYDIKNHNWIQLETVETSKDDIYTYFESKSNSLSIFAISGIGETQVLPKETPVDTPITETSKVPETIPTKAPGFESIVAIVVLSIVYVLGRKKR